MRCLPCHCAVFNLREEIMLTASDLYALLQTGASTDPALPGWLAGNDLRSSVTCNSFYRRKSQEALKLLG